MKSVIGSIAIFSKSFGFVLFYEADVKLQVNGFANSR